MLGSRATPARLGGVLVTLLLLLCPWFLDKAGRSSVQAGGWAATRGGPYGVNTFGHSSEPRSRWAFPITAVCRDGGPGTPEPATEGPAYTWSKLVAKCSSPSMVEDVDRPPLDRFSRSQLESSGRDMVPYPGRQFSLAATTAASEEQTPSALARLPVNGRHVLVGIVDSGIDYRNPDFRNPDGSTRIKYIWDQTRSGKPPSGFSFGYECDSAAINSRRCPERDTEGHGTAVTGIAAGNGRSGGSPRVVGVAPNADIVAVKSSLGEDQTIAAWRYLAGKAKQLGEPIVINNSFGGQLGPHDGTEAEARAIDALSGRGVIFVGAAGNGGHQRIHTSGTIVQGGKSSVTVSAVGPLWEVAFALFYPTRDDLVATLTNTRTGERYGPVDIGGRIDTHPAKDGDVTITIDAHPPDARHNSVVVDLVRPSGKPLNGTWRLQLTGKRVAGRGRYDAWMLVGGDELETFSHPDESDTLSVPADARSVITVANYATHVRWADRQGHTYHVCDYTPCANGVLHVGEIAFNSSLGPTADGRQKPDIAAPGVLISSTLSADTTLCKRTASDPEDCIDPAFISRDGKHYVLTGASMSVPYVTGTVALMLQADPTLDPKGIDTILRSTARHDRFTGKAAWTPSFGAGKVNVNAAVRRALARRVTQ